MIDRAMESDLTPMAAAPLPTARRVLVLAPHPDDEVFGCGGTLHLLFKAGASVSVIVACDGALGGANGEKRSDSLMAEREAETRAAAEVLGYPAPAFWRLPDRGLRYGEALVARLLDAMQAAHADLVFAPALTELHPDHQTLSLAAAEALRRAGGERSIAFYEISAPLLPNMLIDITPAEDLKRTAMRCFRSQLAQQPYGERIAALNRYRCYTLGPAAQAAEAFFMVTAAQLANGLAPLFESALGRRRRLNLAVEGTELPLVSVILRSMDRPTLAEALNSIAQQTYSNLEVVAVAANGANHPELPPLCGRFPLRLVGRDRPRKRGAAANIGLANARGTFICFLDDDDTFDAGHLSGLVRYLVTHPEARVAYAGVRLFTPEGRLARTLHEPFDARHLYRANFLPIHAPLFDRRLIDEGVGFDETLEVYEDWDFWVSLARRTPFHRVDQISASYHLRGTSGVTSQQDQEIVRAGRRAMYSKWRDVWSSDEIERAFAAAEERIGGLEGMFAAAQERIAGLEDELRSAQREVNNLSARLALAEARAGEAEWLAADLAAARDALLNSTSWRITAPLRALRQRLQTVARYVFRALPLSPYRRAILRQWLSGRVAGRTPGSPLSVGEAPISKEEVRAQAHQRLLVFLASGGRIAIPHAAAPEVSILIVLYNQAGLTLECLKALANETSVRFETLIIDNASGDETPRLLERVDGARVARNGENRGFVLAVNQAAAMARGHCLLMLNNDAVILPGTLAAALRRIESHSDIGAVGGRIVLYDGSLQEAGNIVWRDGSCLGYGRGGYPDAPEYRFVRDVDYCSGAFLLVRRDLFERLGGLDEAFVPAYYEEADLCFRLRKAGYRVVFDPEVVVRHFEFASSETSTRAIELQARHCGIFRERHPESLARRYERDTASVLRARSLIAEGARRVLFVDDRVPHPSLGSGYPRSCEFVRAIVEAGHFVTFFPLQFPEDDWDKVYETLADTVEVMLHQGAAGLPAFLGARSGYYDVLVVSRPHNMSILADIRRRRPEWFSGTALVYDAEAVFAVRETLKAEVLGNPLSPGERQRLLSSELELARGADHVTAASASEAEQFVAHGVRAVSVVGNALTPRPTRRSFAERRGFLFVGALVADDSPNADSLVWFAEKVWPHVVAKLGDGVKLQVAGPCDSPAVRRLAGPGIRILGRVDCLDDLYDMSRVFIAPTRFAAGIPHKAQEAAAHGLPIVATPLIAQQLGWTAELLVAADAEAFAAACAALHENEPMWNETRDRALERVARDCDPRIFARTVADIIRTAPVGPRVSHSAARRRR